MLRIKILVYTIIITLCFSIFFQYSLLIVVVNFISVYFSISYLIKVILTPSLRFNFFYTSSLMTLLATNIGGVIEFSLQKFSIKSFEHFLLTKNIQFEYLALSHLIVFVFSICLVFVGFKLKQQINQIISIVFATRLEKDKMIFTLWIIGISIQSYLIISGFVGFMGTLHGVRLTSEPLFILAAPLSSGLCFLSGILLYRFNSLNSTGKIILFFTILTEFIWFFFYGRRSFIFAIAVVILGYIGYRPIKIRGSVIIFNSFLILFVWFIVSTFQFIRSTNLSFEKRNLSVFEVNSMFDNVVSADQEILQNKNLENIRHRLFIMTTFPQVVQSLHQDENSSFALGNSILSHFLKATPGDLIVEKESIISADLLYYHYIPVLFRDGEYDTVSTVYIESYLDFGIIGILVVVIILLILFKTGVFFFKFYPNIYVFFIGNFMFQYLNIVESSLSAFFVELRNLIFLLFFSLFIRVIFIIYKNK